MFERPSLIESDKPMRLVVAVWAALGGTAIAVWVFLAVVHVGDRYATTHVVGSWMALAQYADEGTLVPPLFDAGYFGGTRFMPASIVAHAAVATVTGEYLISGKLLAYGLFVALMAATYAVLRHRGSPRMLSLALASTILLCNPGYIASNQQRGDVLPLLIQLAAVVALGTGSSIYRILAAGVLCGVAVTTKLTAVWAAAAIFIFLFSTSERKRAAVFASTWLASSFLFFVAWNASTNGRLLENLAGTSVATPSVQSLLEAPFVFVDRLASVGGVALIVLAFALTPVALSPNKLRHQPWTLALIVALAIFFGLSVDIGVSINHYLDSLVLSILVLGGFMSKIESASRSSTPWLFSIALAVIMVGGSYLIANRGRDLLDVVDGDTRQFAAVPFNVDRDELLFSEDPGIPVSLGRRPVVLDSFMLLRLEDRHPDWVLALSTRFSSHEFDLVVLERPIDDIEWFTSSHLGPTIRLAIEQNYELSGVVEGYWLYRPLP